MAVSEFRQDQNNVNIEETSDNRFVSFTCSLSAEHPVKVEAHVFIHSCS